MGASTRNYQAPDNAPSMPGAPVTPGFMGTMAQRVIAGVRVGADLGRGADRTVKKPRGPITTPGALAASLGGTPSGRKAGY